MGENKKGCTKAVPMAYVSVNVNVLCVSNGHLHMQACSLDPHPNSSSEMYTLLNNFAQPHRNLRKAKTKQNKICSLTYFFSSF